MPAKPIRAVARALEVLEALNRHGTATALMLARETGIPRPTVYRLLETLVGTGHVAGLGERYTLRLRVRALSDGFEDEAWIAEIAAPALLALTARIRWPCDVGTLEGTEMVIRETTHGVAPFSIDRAMLGRRLPMLESSMGQAYLAFCPAGERAALLRMLGAQAGFARRLGETRRRGYALRAGGGPWPHTGSIALPIMAGGQILGCINAIWMARAVPPEEGIRQCLEPLRETAAVIEGSIAATRK